MKLTWFAHIVTYLWQKNAIFFDLNFDYITTKLSKTQSTRFHCSNFKLGKRDEHFFALVTFAFMLGKKIIGDYIVQGVSTVFLRAAKNIIKVNTPHRIGCIPLLDTCVQCTPTLLYSDNHKSMHYNDMVVTRTCLYIWFPTLYIYILNIHLSNLFRKLNVVIPCYTHSSWSRY